MYIQVQLQVQVQVQVLVLVLRIHCRMHRHQPSLVPVVAVAGCRQQWGNLPLHLHLRRLRHLRHLRQQPFLKEINIFDRDSNENENDILHNYTYI